MLMGITQEGGENDDMRQKPSGAMTLSNVRGYGIQIHLKRLSLDRSVDTFSLW